MNKLFKLALCACLACGVSLPATAADSKDLPLDVGHSSTDRKFRITNKGECPINKLEIWTLPPESSFLQRLSRGASFKAKLGTLEKQQYIDVPYRQLVNNDGKRLDDGYIIELIKFRGSHCGNTRYLTLKVSH